MRIPRYYLLLALLVGVLLLTMLIEFGVISDGAGATMACQAEWQSLSRFREVRDEYDRELKRWRDSGYKSDINPRLRDGCIKRLNDEITAAQVFSLCVAVKQAKGE